MNRDSGEVILLLAELRQGKDETASRLIPLVYSELRKLIGFQFFNLFNHPNFGLPDADIGDQSFGQIFYLESPPTGILGSGLGGDAAPRNIQLKVQLKF